MDKTFSDEPLRPVQRQSLLTLARQLAPELKTASGDKAVLALYEAPGYLGWLIEAFSNLATGGVQEPAVSAALQMGLDTIWSFPSVSEICKARKTLVALGDPETMDSLDHCPPLRVSSGAGDSRAYRFHIGKELKKAIAKLATTLGISQSRLGAIALMVGLLHEPALSRLRYRKDMLRILRAFDKLLERRAVEARDRVATARPRDESKNHLFTIADLRGPWATDEDEDDD